MIVKAENAIALADEIRIASRVALLTRRFKMLAAIEFDDEFGRFAHEVRDIGTNRLLPTEAGAIEAVGA